ncbi:MAG TPA: DUF3455 domain-containing protein [Steroidobacteraceae bacterium]
MFNAALAAVSLLSLSPLTYAHIENVQPPYVPPDIRVPEGNFAFLKGRAEGTQNYACSPSGTGFAWVLFTPEATLFNGADKEIITHFFDPNPDPSDRNTDARVVANGAIRAAWKHSRDASTVWAKVFGPPVTMRSDSIPWLLLQVVGRQEGPNGGDTLFPTTFIQRLNTRGGVAPASGCSQASDVGKKAFIPYTADYFFFLDPTAEVSQ